MREYIKLSECPEALQQSISLYLEKFPAVKILSVQKWESTPYKDKSIIETDYKVFTLHGNYFSVYSLSVCSKAEWNDRDVVVSSMIAGEIAEIVKLTPVWFE